MVEPEWDNPFGPGKTILVENAPGDPDLFVPAGQRARYEAAFARFCSVFPDMFYKESRGRNYFRTGRDEGRYLSAGFHNVMGYFRDDQPLYELLLDEKQQASWTRCGARLDFVASANIRTYMEFALNWDPRDARRFQGRRARWSPCSTKRKSRPRRGSSNSKPSTWRVAKDGNDVSIKAIKDYFTAANEGIRWVEQARLNAEPSHLKALLDFAARAFRRPLSQADRDDLLEFYRTARERDGLDHETAVREAIVSC